jgi:hypothetical protein
MRPAARTGLALALVLWLLAPGLRADPNPSPSPTPSPAPVLETLDLKDGRVLHHVRIMEDEDTAIVVHADEGLLKIAKSLLPAGVAKPAPDASVGGDGDTIMAPFNPNPPPEPPPEKPVAPPKPVVPKVAPEKAGPNPVFEGCTIISFQPKEMQTALGCAEVVIQNDTDSPVLIQPKDIVCIATSGQRHMGRIFITDGIPPIVKHKEIVPSHGQVDDLLTFTNAAIDVQTVQWSR